MGISGKPDQLLNKELIKNKPIDVIRRFSGGGTVIVDHNTIFITFIIDSSTIKIEPFPDKIFKWSEEIYKPIFDGHPFKLIENDYVLENRKFGGNAQYIKKDRVLHHTSFLWDFEPIQMDYLLLPSKRPNYRQNRNHCDFLCTLKDYFVSYNHFEDKLLDNLNLKFQVEEDCIDSLGDILGKEHRQTTCLVNL